MRQLKGWKFDEIEDKSSSTEKEILIVFTYLKMLPHPSKLLYFSLAEGHGFKLQVKISMTATILRPCLSSL